MHIAAGNQKQPFSLSLEMSSNDIPFTERSIDTDMITTLLDRAIGVRVDANGENWFFAGGFYGDAVAPDGDNQVEGWGTSMKAVITPIKRDDAVVHLGFRGAFRRPETNNESIRFRTETTHMSDFHPTSSGTIQDIDGIFLYGPEFAVAMGPFSVFGEYNRAMILRDIDNQVTFDAFHVGATLSLTGESRAPAYAIKSGEFKRLKPAKNFSIKNGGPGAWELAVRYAYLDLNRGILDSGTASELPGGREQALTVALNWYLNDNVRVQWNYRHIIETDQGSQVPNRDTLNKEAAGLDMFTTRVQFNF